MKGHVIPVMFYGMKSADIHLLMGVENDAPQ